MSSKKTTVILRKKDGRGKEVFGAVVIDGTEEKDFIEKTKEAGTFAKVLEE